MSLETRWDPGAVEDLSHGRDWYEDRRPGLGHDFVTQVFEAVQQAERFPLAHRRYDHDLLSDRPEIRKVQLARFDEYGVVYALVGGTLWIVAIAHAKRRPGYWADRMKNIR